MTAGQLPGQVSSPLSTKQVQILQMAIRATAWRPITDFGIQSLDDKEIYVIQSLVENLIRSTTGQDHLTR